ncbi:PspC domain-containing protein, partial [Saccharopolyspora sp. NPDC000359]|uniref:PspC domain-containing protein n=1 Tax=Saccharopolyspora sp. NPDC000359 TaxID=3154251 RepID=UPI0033262480
MRDQLNQQRDSGPGAPTKPMAQRRPQSVAQLRRRRGGRLVAGVASGVAEHLGVPVLYVRIGFAVLAVCGGAGVLAYSLLWVFVPQSTGTEAPVSTKERQQGFGVILLGVGAMVAVGGLVSMPAWLSAPLVVVLVGAAVVWREADESQRRRWRQGARTNVVGALHGGGGRSALIRVLAGAALVVVGIVMLLAGST